MKDNAPSSEISNIVIEDDPKINKIMEINKLLKCAKNASNGS